MDLAYQVESAARTHLGRKRANNEDYVAFFEPAKWEELQTNGRMYLVADGVGGAARGERASQYAAQKVLFEYYQNPEVELGERLKLVMRKAGNEIYAYASQSGRFAHMATTMVVAVVRGSTLTVANVGDSRAYLIRDGTITQISRDHTIAEELLREGIFTEEEALSSKGKNRLTRSLGGEPNVQVDVFADIALRPGDRILLCSDGLTRYASREDLVRMTAEGTAGEVVEGLVTFANERGGADNISAILITIGESIDAQTFESQEARGQVPTEVDWDAMVTLPDVPVRPDRWQPVRIQLERWLEQVPRGYLPWIVLVVGLLCVGGVAGVIIGSQFPQGGGAVSQTETAQPATPETGDPGAVTDKPTPVSLPTDTPEPTLTPTATVTAVKPTATITPTHETAATPTGTQQSDTEIAEEGGVCVVKVLEGENLTRILGLFPGIEFVSGEDYYRCLLVTQAEGSLCVERQVLDEDYSIDPDDWIVIPGVLERECGAPDHEAVWVQVAQP